MNGSFVKVDGANHSLSSLSRSFNDLSCDQELHRLKSSPLRILSQDAKEKCASLPDITLPKISSGKRRGESSLSGQSNLDSARLSRDYVIPSCNDVRQRRISNSTVQKSLTRPKSCTARVHLTPIAPRTPEFLRRKRMPWPSWPFSMELIKTRSAPTSPILSKKHSDSAERPSVSKSVSFTSSISLVEDTVFEEFSLRRKSNDHGSTLSSTPLVSHALRRKFEDSEKTARKAKNLIDDFKRSCPVKQRRDQIESKSLAEALDEVKNCRYLRVVNRK